MKIIYYLFGRGLDVNNSDCDDDGLLDGGEVKNYNTAPLNNDTDHDGLYDGEEINIYNTNATNPDTDGDGLTDGDEVNVWMSDPLCKNPFPFWGFTWHFSWNWVSGDTIGDASNNYYVDYNFQFIWDNYFKPTYGRTIRCDIDVMNAVSSDYTTVDQKVINRATNLCLWAKENDAQLFPVLKGTGDWDMSWQWVWIGASLVCIYAPDPNCHKDTWYINKVGVFVKELATTVCNIDPEAYKRIVAYQVENEMNHDMGLLGGGHHDNWAESWEINLMAGGSEAIRNAEIEANVMSYCGRYTPLVINPNYDVFVLWAMGTGSAYSSLKNYIKKVLDDSRSKIDIIGLDYYPISWTPGVTESDIKTIINSLCNDFGLQSSYGKFVMVTETGYSDKDNSNLKDEQRNYYRDVTNDLINYYGTQGGREKGFIGVVWYQLFDCKDDHGQMWPNIVERNFGVIETPQSIGDCGWTGVTSSDLKDAWNWLVYYLYA